MPDLTVLVSAFILGSIGLNAVLWFKLRQGMSTKQSHKTVHDNVKTPSVALTQTAFPAPATLFSPLFFATAAAIDVGLIVVDITHKIRFLNTQAEELLGQTAHEVYNHRLITLIPDHQAEALVCEVIKDNDIHETTIHPPLSGRTLRIRCAPLSPSDTFGGAVLLIRDVTQISMLERSRRDLVANVSHELRTPLTSLKLLVETVQSEPPLSVAQRMLGQMAQEVDAITQLVDELHELSQIESGRVTLQLTPTPIATVINRALERIRPQADRKKLHITAHISPNHPTVLIDNNRVGQVLLNLLHNAVKFTMFNGAITVQTTIIDVGEDKPNRKQSILPHLQNAVTLSIPIKPEPHYHTPLATEADTSINVPLSHPPGAWMIVSISDTGIGIPAQELGRIFERFYKVDRSRSRNIGGSGLGLAIAKHLIEGHGGRLWVNSQAGQGSTFYFTLPLT